MRIGLLVDYRGCFWSSTTNVRTGTTMNVSRISELLSDAGHEPDVMEFADVDLGQRWHGVPVVFTSAEDRGLAYKGYIEDIVLALESAGARTFPRFPLLRAHHNKVFMELLRKQLAPETFLSRETRTFGAFEEFQPRVGEVPMPAVVKSAAGAGSSGVRLVATLPEALIAARSLSQSDPRLEEVRELAKQRLRPGYRRTSTHRSKFIVQPLIPNLRGDFKVLKYGRRYFAVYRGNRAEVAMASGGGLLDFDVDSHVDVEALLAFAADFAEAVANPWLSMDIAHVDGGFQLIEFQALHFGPATLEKSEFHYLQDDRGGFQCVPGQMELEQAFVDALCDELN